MGNNYKKNNNYKNNIKKEGENMEKRDIDAFDDVKLESELESADKLVQEEVQSDLPIEPKADKKPKKSEQSFKVYSIVSEKAVMAKGLVDGKWYSKPNKKYRIGDIIE